MTVLCAGVGKFSSLYPVPAPLCVFEEGNGRNKKSASFGMIHHLVIEDGLQCLNV